MLTLVSSPTAVDVHPTSCWIVSKSTPRGIAPGLQVGTEALLAPRQQAPLHRVCGWLATSYYPNQASGGTALASIRLRVLTW